MRHVRSFLACLAVIAVVLSPLAHGQTLGAVLTGGQEVPPNDNSGFGNATVAFDATRQNVHVTITVANLGSPINNFHIHEAPPGVNGPIVINLIALGGVFVNGTMTGTFPVAPAVAQRMLENPRNFYVNVHTVALPGGAVRGQLGFVEGGTVTYAAELRPGNEVPPVNSIAFGSAFVTFNPATNSIAWEARASGIGNPTMAHIHRGAAGTNGPVVINFATTPAQIPGGRTHGAGPVTQFQSGNLQPADLANLYNPATASGYYVNVHSAAFGGGEIRGQLVPANEYGIPIAGHITNGLGQTFVTDVRVFNPSYTAVVTALLEYFEAGIGANATSSQSIVVNIPQRGTAVLDDVVGAAHLNRAGTSGAIRVSSANPLAVTSRVYIEDHHEHGGTVGQFVPAPPRSFALRRGVAPHLSNSTDLSTGFRTNVGFFNPGQSDAVIRMELRDAAGFFLAQTTLVLGAQSQQQQSILTYFPDADLNGKEVTLSFDSSVPVIGYAAVNDNRSGDAILVPALPDLGVAASEAGPVQ